MTANEAARTMTFDEYRRWWYSELNLTPPAEGERLSVSQYSDERLIRQGYNYRNGLPLTTSQGAN